MRNTLKLLKKTLDDNERAAKAAVAVTVLEKAKELCAANPDAEFLVQKLEAYNNTKALDGALKQVRALNPYTSALFVSVDPDSKKIFCLAAVTKPAVEKGLKANEWIQHVSGLMGGKGGGKAESAQASGPNYEKADEILELAKQFASAKLA
jgi:alanyl-tRNA synthetase